MSKSQKIPSCTLDCIVERHGRFSEPRSLKPLKKWVGRIPYRNGYVSVLGRGGTAECGAGRCRCGNYSRSELLRTKTQSNNDASFLIIFLSIPNPKSLGVRAIARVSTGDPPSYLIVARAENNAEETEPFGSGTASRVESPKVTSYRMHSYIKQKVKE